MLGNTTSMVFELWLNVSKLECLDHPHRELAWKNPDAVLKYLRQSENIHGFAFCEDVFEPIQKCLPWCGSCEVELPKDGLLDGIFLVAMRNEANDEKYRLEEEHDKLGAEILDVYFYFIQWLYDGWPMLGGDRSRKAIVQYLADRL